jgi:Protein of unknown function (DUF3037)
MSSSETEIVSRSRGRTAYHYAVFRFVPDPIREEFINVALVLTDDRGEYSRLEFNPHTKTRMSQMGAEAFHDRLVDYFERLRSNFDTAGRQTLSPGLTQPTLSRNLLEEWATEHGSLLHMTPIRVFLAENPDEAFDGLYQRYVGGRRPPVVSDAVTESVAPEEERGTLVNSFVSALRHRRNFDSDRILRDQEFLGRTRHHWLDVIVSGNGAGPSFAHALPFRSREEKHLFLHRGAILDAAEDSSPESVKLALYQDPPIERADLLKETSALLFDRGVRLYRTSQLDDAAELFESRLFDSH